jgi:hypothetical protein
MRKITKYGVGTSMLGISSVVIGLFAPATGWIKPRIAQVFTILGFILFIIGCILAASGLRSNQATESIEQKFDRLLEGLDNQSNRANRNTDNALGITETATGKPALIFPVVDS